MTRHHVFAWPEDFAPLPLGGPKALADAQRGHFYEEAGWYQRFRVAYHLGILLVLAGLGVMPVPKDHVAVFRYVAVVLAAIGVLVELMWILAAGISSRQQAGGIRGWLHRVVGQLVPTADGFAPAPERASKQAADTWPADTAQRLGQLLADVEYERVREALVERLVLLARDASMQDVADILDRLRR